MVYVAFTCVGNPTEPEKVTTRWPEGINVSIPLGGFVPETENFYNLMVMDGDEALINNWINENTGKVEIITKDQANQLGQAIVVPGTERIEADSMKEFTITMTAGAFDVDNPGNLWVETKREAYVAPVVEASPMIDPLLK